MRRSSARFDTQRLSALIPRNLSFRRARSRPFAPFGWLALGAGLATLGITLLDPARGGARRAMLRDKTSSSLRRLRDGTRGRLVHVGSRARGALHDMRARMRETEIPDSRLEERVRAQIGRAVSHPGALRVSAVEGRVEIAGPILANEVDALVQRVRRVRGVKDIVDRLDIHEEAGNEPALQGAGSCANP